MSMHYITHVYAPLHYLVAPANDADDFGTWRNFCEGGNATSINEYSTMLRGTILMSCFIENVQTEQM